MRPFSRAWFVQHQRGLLWLLACPVLGCWFRWALHIRACDVGYRGRIVQLYPHAYTILNADQTLTTDFRAHNKYAKRLYAAFRPCWWLLHAWDWAIADRWVPALSAGCSTLTKYPDIDPETTTVDGFVRRLVANPGESWATIRAGAGTAAVDSGSPAYPVDIFAGNGASDLWINISRYICLFDTSLLTAASSISAVTLSLTGTAKVDGNVATPDADIYTSSPASNTALVAADYAQLGTTSQTGAPVTYANLSSTTYVNFVFNATGIANVSKTGVSKFGCQNANYDVANVAPPWVSSQESLWSVKSTTTISAPSTDPKLVVTYTIGLFATIDETTASDVDYDTSAVAPSNDTMEVQLTSIFAPQPGAVTITIRHRFH